MAYVATVSKKGLMTLPSKLRRKLSIQEGSKVKLIEHEGHVTLVPITPLHKLYGTGREHSADIKQAVEELEKEHDEEANL